MEGHMSETKPRLPSPPCRPPLSIAGRSPFDERRLHWQGAGGGGVFFGVLFLLLAIATWVIAFRADWDWYSIPRDYRLGVVAAGASIGVTFVYIFFGIFFLVIWVLRHLADWM